jgi:uncharacterized protein YifN (PemK superfamily)
MTVERAGLLVAVRINDRLHPDDARALAADLTVLADAIDADIPAVDETDITAEISAALERLPDDVARWTKADVIQALGKRLARAGYKRRTQAKVKPVDSTVAAGAAVTASVNG